MNWQVLVTALIPLLEGLRGSINPPPRSPASANQAVKHLQAFLNSALGLNPPLKVDGWLGPKTDAAIEAGIALLRQAGIGR